LDGQADYLLRMQSETQAATLTRLLQQYEPALWRLVNSYEVDRSRREDLFQEIALGLWQAIPRFRGDSSERTWLYRIAHNIAISTLDTRRRRERSELPITDSIESPTAGEAPDQAVLSGEKRDAMMKAIRELPASARQVIVLYLEGLSYEEIEEISGLSQSAIATRLSRIRSRLAEIVQRREVRK
jgi:RNA polymerase sigma-70 factor (ECF subfamily)